MKSLKISESDWQRTIIDLLHAYGYRVAHFRPGMTSREYTNKRGETKKVWVTPVSADGAGFPDIVAVRVGIKVDFMGWSRKPRILFIELKSETGKLSPDQIAWKEAIEKSGGEYILARPSDYDRLTKELR